MSSEPVSKKNLGKLDIMIEIKGNEGGVTFDVLTSRCIDLGGGAEETHRNLSLELAKGDIVSRLCQYLQAEAELGLLPSGERH